MIILNKEVQQMNNRYIFRGKRKDNGEWIDGYLYITHNGEYEISRYDNVLGVERLTRIVIPETIGQCTGLRDKNGNLIFEDDFLRFTNYDGKQSTYKVFYDDICAGWRVGEVSCGCIEEMSDWESYRKYFEVLSNIHDNPELLLEVER